jgi:hypothetical protein
VATLGEADNWRSHPSPALKEIKAACLATLQAAARTGEHMLVDHKGEATRCTSTEHGVMSAQFYSRRYSWPLVEVLFSDLKVVRFRCVSNLVARLLFVDCQEIKQAEGWVAAAVRHNEKGEVCDAL